MPFADVRMLPDGFSLPELKWREMLFVGATAAAVAYGAGALLGKWTA